MSVEREKFDSSMLGASAFLVGNSLMIWPELAEKEAT